MDAQSKEEMKKEAFVMKELSHPCIVRLYGVTQSRKMNSTLMVFMICSKNMSFLMNGSIKCLIFLFRIIFIPPGKGKNARCFGYWFKQTNTLRSNNKI
jgi:serine/threonine protein kinase